MHAIIDLECVRVHARACGVNANAGMQRN